jgi:hypothetical protein
MCFLRSHSGSSAIADLRRGFAVLTTILHRTTLEEQRGVVYFGVLPLNFSFEGLTVLKFYRTVFRGYVTAGTQQCYSGAFSATQLASIRCPESLPLGMGVRFVQFRQLCRICFASTNGPFSGSPTARHCHPKEYPGGMHDFAQLTWARMGSSFTRSTAALPGKALHEGLAFRFQFACNKQCRSCYRSLGPRVFLMGFVLPFWNLFSEGERGP